MNETKITEEEKKLVTQFMDKSHSFFENWFNGSIDQEELQTFKERMDDEWILVNNKTPKVINDKETFLEVWPSMYGRFSEHPIKQSYEIRLMQKIAANKILVTYYEKTEKVDETLVRPISTLLILDKETEDVKVRYVHE